MNYSRTLPSLTVLLSLLPLIAACGSSISQAAPATPSSVTGSSNRVTADQLTGSWSLVSIQPAGQAVQTIPQDAVYALTLADGRLSTRADCNVCGGTFELSGETLTAGPALACTRAACPTMAFENTYTTLLSGESAVTMSGNTLTLSSARGVLRFMR